MKKIFLRIALIVSAFEAYAQGHVETTVRFTNDQNEVASVTFGVDVNATAKVDTALGEKLLPPVFPPDGMFAYLSFPFDSLGDAWSPKDFRKLPNKEKFSETFVIRIPPYESRGGAYTISWDNLSLYIDSARVYDVFSGTIINFSLKGNSSVRIQNQNPGTGKDVIQELHVDVHYSRSPNDVEENKSENILVAIPNPVKEFTTINSEKNFSSYEVLNSIGEKIISQKNSSEKILLDLGKFSSGLYIFRGITVTGEIETAKIIKQ